MNTLTCPSDRRWIAGFGRVLIPLLLLGAMTARAQWTGGAGNSLYNDTANWTSGSINGQFTAVAPGTSLLFNADIATSIGFAAGTTFTTTLSGSGGTRTLTLNGDLKGTSGTSNVTIDSTLILNLNGSTRTFGDTSGGGTWNIAAKITGTGGVTLGGGTGFVNLSNNSNDFTGNVTYNRRGGSFSSIADSGVASALGAGSTITVNDSVSFGSLTYTGAAASSNRNWVWNNGSTSYSFNQNGTGALTLTGTWNFSAASTTQFTVNANNAALILNGVINDSSGSNQLGLIFAGSQTKTLNGLNTFEGPVAVRAGVLEFNTAASSGSASALGAGAVINVGTAASSTAATLRYTGTVAGGHSTNRTINLLGTTAAHAIEASGAGALNLSGPLASTEAGAKTLSLGGTSAAGVLNTISGSITETSGSIAITKSGTNTWVLSGTNSNTGLTTVSGGVLTLQGDQSGATGGYLLNAATASTLNFASGATINTISGKSISVATGASVGLTLNSAATVVNAGSLSLQRGATLNLTGGTWTQSGSLTVGGNGGFRAAMNVSAGIFTYTGSSAAIGYDGSQPGLVAVSGTGEVRFQGTGDVSVGRGVVNAGQNAMGGEIAVNTGGTLSTQQKFVLNVEEGRISLGGGTVKLSANLTDFSDNLPLVVTTTSATTFDTNGFSTTIDDTISSSAAGGLVKQGAGTLVLKGSNTYAGPTTVSGGVLQVGAGGIGQTGSGVITVQNSGTLLGTGTIKGSSFAALNGSVVQAGDGVSLGSYGTLAFTPSSGPGSFDFQSGSMVVLGINPGGAGDLLSFDGVVNGTLLFDGNLQVTAAGYMPASIEVFNLLDWVNLSTILFDNRYRASSYGGYILGNGDDNLGFDLPDISGSGYGWDISQFTANGSISTALIVPEPGRAALLLLGLAGLMTRRRRRAGLPC